MRVSLLGLHLKDSPIAKSAAVSFSKRQGRLVGLGNCNYWKQKYYTIFWINHHQRNIFFHLTIKAQEKKCKWCLLAPGLWMNRSKAKAQAMSEGCELPKNPMVRVSAAQDCHHQQNSHLLLSCASSREGQLALGLADKRDYRGVINAKIKLHIRGILKALTPVLQHT